MLQSKFPKANMNTMILNPISNGKLKSEPHPDPTGYNNALFRTNPKFGSARVGVGFSFRFRSGIYTSSTD